MDDFEKAILLSFDQSGDVGAGIKAQAEAYLAAARASPDAWRICLDRFQSSGYAEVRFWCAQALTALAAQQQPPLPPQARGQLKAALLASGTGAAGGPPLPGFLKNKVAQAIVALAGREYPDEWPSFFQDLLGTLGAGPPAVDLFCRILAAVDQDIISLELPRSAEEAKQSMHFKDSMRERALGDIADAWCALLAAYTAPAPDTAAAVLETVQRYVHWIDIGLVANDRFVPLLFGALAAPQEGLRGAAADVLTEIVSKRMEATPKLTLIQQLGVVPVCARWQAGLPAVDEEPELAVKYSRLLAALATEVLEAWKKVENSVLSMAAVGLAVDAEAAADAQSACATASALLDALFPAVLAALRAGHDEVAAAVVPFLLSFVGRLRALQKRAGPDGVLPPGQAAHVPAILEALAACARFPQDSAAYEVAAASATERVAAEEEESAMADRRQDLFTLFRNAANLARPEAYRFVGGLLGAALSGGGGGSASWQDVEVSVTLLYQLGEGAPEGDMRPGSGVLAQLAAGVMQAESPASKHRLVALALLETYVRYSRVLAAGGGAALPAVVARFLDEHGMGHSSEAVSKRAAYLFCRLAKQLRANLRPLLPDILQRLQPHLAAIAATPTQEAPTTKGTGVTGGRGGAGQGLLGAVDDRLYAFEAAGLLLGQEELPAAEQRAWVAALLQPLVAQMEGNLAAAAAGGAAAAAAAMPGAPPPPALLVQQALEAVTRVGKGLALKLCTEQRPELGGLLVGALQAAVAAPRALPHNKQLRARFISFLHRMLECLGATLLPCLPPALEVLLNAQADACDVADVLLLLNQLLARFKEALAPVMQEMVPACVARVHTVLPADWDWSGARVTPAALATPTAVAAAAAGSPFSDKSAAASAAAGAGGAGSNEDLRERAELQRAYYSFCHSLVHNRLAGVLLGAPPGTLDAMLGALMRGAATHVDAGVRKTCVQAVERLVGEWCGADGSEALPGFREFAMKQFGGEVLLEALVAGGVDIRDAAAISLLTEVAQSLQLVHQRCGEAYLSYLCTALLPSMGWPAEASQQLVAHITGSQPKALKDFLKVALQQLRQQQQQQAAANGRR
ncbi:exportin-T isoform X1 [Micractinium conductrix]|uniref:Exportin-T n=1 Tax=Micractinium conductrix TaxID=554055 RepID=A0A2P6VD49_9CHLO|nr:exportin-T isoform X1 [Micractinium conductrix]|eukprot:PSC72015.1 exportin-T isoform X1 [Micractinium conductrix]